MNGPGAMLDVRPRGGVRPLPSRARPRTAMRAHLGERELTWPTSALARPRLASGRPLAPLGRLDPPDPLPRGQHFWLGDTKSRRHDFNPVTREKVPISASKWHLEPHPTRRDATRRPRVPRPRVLARSLRRLAPPRPVPSRAVPGRAPGLAAQRTRTGSRVVAVRRRDPTPPSAGRGPTRPSAVDACASAGRRRRGP